MASFYDAVYAMVRQVPAGQVTTYGAIARLCGQPRGARAVGYALRALQPGTDVPWQRVVNAQGGISLRGEDGEDLQRALLAHEGIVFDADGHVPLARYAWAGPGAL